MMRTMNSRTIGMLLLAGLLAGGTAARAAGVGTVWAWGNNSKGELGDGTQTRRLSPVQVLGLTNAIAIGCGFYGAWAVKSDGTTCGWGDNTYG